MRVASININLACEAQLKFAAVTYPFQIHHSVADQICLIGGSERLISAQPQPVPKGVVKKLKLFEGAHELHNEKEWRATLEDAHFHFQSVGERLE